MSKHKTHTKPHSRKRKLFSDYSDFTIFVVVLLIATLGAVVWLFTVLSDTVTDHRALESRSNQACVGIAAASNSGFEIDVDTLYVTSELKSITGQGEVANQRCIVNGETDDETTGSQAISSYNYGADITYFSDSQSAKSYADNNLVPLRDWQADTTGKYYIFMVENNGDQYFDAFTVKGSAVARISLPCSETDDLDRCKIKADRAMSLFNKKISVLNVN